MKTRYGSMQTLDVERDLISRCLDCFGEWAWHEVVFVGSILPLGGRVLDIGAFLGTFSLGLAICSEVNFLCAVEANPSIVPLLENNMRRNVQHKAVVVEAMVAAASTEARPGRAAPDNQGAMSFQVGAMGEIETARPARTTTLADLRNEYGPFDLIKVDAEGMELEILTSDSEYLVQGKTTLWIECNEGPASLELAEKLLSWGMDVFYFAFPAHNTDNFSGSKHALLPMAYEAGLLAAPRVVPELSAELAAHGCIFEPIEKIDDLRRAMWRTPRWGMAEWVDATPATVIALTVHALLGDEFAGYLAPGWQRGKPLWSRLTEAQAVLADRTAELAAVHESLAKACDRTGSTEAALAHVEQQVSIIRAEFAAERQAHAATADALRTIEASAAPLQSALEQAQARLGLSDDALGVVEARSTRERHELALEHRRQSATLTELSVLQADCSNCRTELAAAQQSHMATLATLKTTEVVLKSLQAALQQEEGLRDTAERALHAAEATNQQLTDSIQEERQLRMDVQATLAVTKAMLTAREAELVAEQQRRAEQAAALQAAEEALAARQEALTQARDQLQRGDAELRHAKATIAQHLGAYVQEHARRLDLESVLSARDAEIAQARSFGDRCGAALAEASALSLERLGQLTTLRREVGSIHAALLAKASDRSAGGEAPSAPIRFTGEAI